VPEGMLVCRVKHVMERDSIGESDETLAESMSDL
jgi:hypothetical protein